ncbi:MAG: ABC transporter ATP-binding protein [Bosea sp.]|jgi:putative spermidine/putrescine transport system ATP-binding protein|uniref:ABC transporter ATP-binding protein n=1 Tax=Bosea sp. (in: a-proteobacteria) TaxID=1871050 RepID=UPI001AC71B25|nr:ABC transporter ATP-binding protein [Bosea sp. (in: a-proteobacteria)]MBN9448838.1 ABC transporter ATP-binding protein [Bosea sp. (in: a-proteobacteria)]MBN9470980.1 ABC transporter ATP-binding protein [Bosea sp. (in: a-proteobacteria)]
MARLSIEHLRKTYGEFHAVDDFSIDIADGEFLVLLGPSGCGKTTTLRMVAGFIQPTAGRITIGERDVTNLPPWKRNCGLVFQSYALFPHMSVADNVAFGLEMRRMAPAERAPRVAEALRLVQLSGFDQRYPRQLSGGQQQRVALARALAMQPDVLLLDEPLSNLDAKLRQEVRVEIRDLQRKLGLTTIMVTHDQEEALTMADRLVVMEKGKVRQIGTQRELYEKPADRFVAGFIGRSAFLDGEIAAPGRFRSQGGLEIDCSAPALGPATLALRPERLAIGAQAESCTNRFQARVEHVSYLGALLDIDVRLTEHDRMLLQLPNRQGTVEPKPGDRITIGWAEDAGLVYPRES